MDKKALVLSAACFATLVSGAQAQDHAAAAGRAPEQRSEAHQGPKRRDNATSELFRLLDRNATWVQVDRVVVDFTTFHTQGLVKIGDLFYVSAVEVITSTTRNGTSTDALYDFSIDRSEGEGRGWVFKFDATGALVGKVELTNGTIYHPGGMDFDGKYLWTAVAEYRPNSKSLVYRIDPATLKAELMFAVDDHIGGVVHNVANRTIHGVSWGSRRLYTWQLANRPHGQPRVVRESWEPNAEFYIDYQDCHSQGVEQMLCGGVASFATPYGSVALGGLDLVDLRTGKPSHQIPVNRFIDEGTGPKPTLSLAHNAFWAEPNGNNGLRIYFMTETNNQADLQVFDVTPWVNRTP